MDKNVEIRYDEDENAIVVINDIKFKGKRRISWNDVKQYLIRYVGTNCVIQDTEKLIHIEKDMPDEYTGSVYTRSLKGANAKAKANASQGILEMIKTATNERFKENLEEKHRFNAKFGWYKYNSKFALPVYGDHDEVDRYNVFSAELLIRHDMNGKYYLYDIVNIKKRNEQPALPNAYGKKPIS